MAHSEDVVVVANGAVLAGLALASPADFIRESAPRGAYTAGRAEFGKGMGWWSAHLARLRRSLRAMRERDPGCFELGSEIPADDDTLATWVAPSVKLALDAIDAKTLANAKPCDAGALEMIDDASARSTRRMFFLSPSLRNEVHNANAVVWEPV